MTQVTRRIIVDPLWLRVTKNQKRCILSPLYVDTTSPHIPTDESEAGLEVHKEGAVTPGRMSGGQADTQPGRADGDCQRGRDVSTRQAPGRDGFSHDPPASEDTSRGGRKEGRILKNLTTHTTHFIYGDMVSDTL